MLRFFPFAQSYFYPLIVLILIAGSLTLYGYLLLRSAVTLCPMLIYDTLLVQPYAPFFLYISALVLCSTLALILLGSESS